MHRQVFNLISVITLFGIIGIMIPYNYILISCPNSTIKLWLKPIPLFLLVANVFIYHLFFTINTYSLLIQLNFIFCLIGDILLMFFFSPFNENFVFLFVGGSSFFIARIVLIVAFSNRIEAPEPKNIAIFSIWSFVYVVFMLLYFATHLSNNILLLLISLYIVVMGVQLTFSFLQQVNTLSYFFSVLGTILFNISDTILLFCIFITPLNYGENVLISFYWISMYFNMISIQDFS